MKLLFFQSLFNKQSWLNIDSYKDPYVAVPFFNDTLISLLDKHAQQKKELIKTCEFLNSIKTIDTFQNQKDLNN